jgi:hypothetical protein
MTSLSRLFVVLCLVGVGGPVWIKAQTPDPRLTVADVEKVSGLSGVKLVPADPAKGAGGDLNFAGPEGKLLLMVRFSTASLYDSLKTGSTFHALVSGVGDEAFDAPPGQVQYVLYVKQGAKAVSITTYASSSKPYGPRLTMDQLKAIANVILARL